MSFKNRSMGWGFSKDITTSHATYPPRTVFYRRRYVLSIYRTHRSPQVIRSKDRKRPGKRVQCILRLLGRHGPPTLRKHPQARQRPLEEFGRVVSLFRRHGLTEGGRLLGRRSYPSSRGRGPLLPGLGLTVVGAAPDYRLESLDHRLGENLAEKGGYIRGCVRL